MSEVQTDRTLASLFTALTRETSSLFRQEVQLAKAEVTDKARQAGWGAAAVVSGGLLLFVAVQALAACAILALSGTLAPWLAALIVGAIIAVVGGIVLMVGLSSLRGERLRPRRTLDELRATGRWAREQLR